MSIVVTGATGYLGRLVVSALLRLDVPRERIVAAGRNGEKLGSLASLGFATALVDYGAPAMLQGAFDAGDTVLLLSGSELGRRVEQHRTVVDAAARAGVDRLVYTSVLGADRGTDLLTRQGGLDPVEEVVDLVDLVPAP